MKIRYIEKVRDHEEYAAATGPGAHVVPIVELTTRGWHRASHQYFSDIIRSTIETQRGPARQAISLAFERAAAIT